MSRDAQVNPGFSREPLWTLWHATQQITVHRLDGLFRKRRSRGSIFARENAALYTYFLKLWYCTTDMYTYCTCTPVLRTISKLLTMSQKMMAAAPTACTLTAFFVYSTILRKQSSPCVASEGSPFTSTCNYFAATP